MKPEAQRITIAESVGWTCCQTHGGQLWGLVPDAAQLDSQGALENLFQVPDYLNDLNAIQEAELKLTAEQRHNYVRQLCSVMDGWAMMPDFSTTFATAAQRAEAYLKTINKWTP